MACKLSIADDVVDIVQADRGLSERYRHSTRTSKAD